MDELSFLPCNEELLPALRDIYAYYVTQTTATFHTQDPSLGMMRSILAPASERHYSCALVSQGQLAGYALLGRFKPREAYDASAEITVYLKPGMTGRGLGSQAVRHLEAVARQRNFHVLLAVISGENTESIKLFEKLGYKKCAHYHQVGKKFGRLLDVVSYEKILDVLP